MKTANMPVYGNIAVYVYVLNYYDIGVYLFNPCAKVTQCSCARRVAP